jgi:mono/diheme cytochrome c family protein
MEADQLQRWAALLQTGETLFNEGSCTRCHGPGGEGGPRAPDLTDAIWDQSDGDLEGIRDTVFWGVRRRDFAEPARPFEMNPTGGMQLEWDEVRAVAAYVWSLSDGTFLPGAGGTGAPGFP